MYQRAWIVFRQFYAQFYNCTDPQLPLPPACIPLFISYLSFRKSAYSTIKLYLSAISYVHKLKGVIDPTKSFVVEKLSTALRRQQPSDIRLPITRPILHELLRSLNFTNPSAFQRSLLSAMFLVAFYGLFRIGELASKSTRSASSVIQYSNLTFSFGTASVGQPQGAKISIHQYKHNVSQRPFDILLARDISSPFCPVTALFHYCKVRGDRPGPLFCYADVTSISAYQFNVELQRCLTYCGLDTSRYKSHSFRIGGACHAAEQGYSDAQIRALGRWKSDAFKVYLRSEVLYAN